MPNGTERDMHTMLSLLQAGAAGGEKAAYTPFADTRASWGKYWGDLKVLQAKLTAAEKERDAANKERDAAEKERDAAKQHASVVSDERDAAWHKFATACQANVDAAAVNIALARHERDEARAQVAYLTANETDLERETRAAHTRLRAEDIAKEQAKKERAARAKQQRWVQNPWDGSYVEEDRVSHGVHTHTWYNKDGSIQSTDVRPT
jgi:chromosome segregation ATPase